MKINTKIALAIFAILSLPLPCHANVIWPAIYVLDSYYRFWYLAIITIIIEAYILTKAIKSGLKKAFLISSVANVFSATVGLYLLSPRHIPYLQQGGYFVSNVIAKRLDRRHPF